MHLQSFDYPFPFIEAPKKPQSESSKEFKDSDGFNNDSLLKIGRIVSETGILSAEMVFMVFNHLPVDITIVDENDKVVFFNKALDRIFPRSPAVIGRTVQNCHPPESVHVVEDIIDAFRAGSKSKADFWIQSRGKFILIQYFALRDESGAYKGVIEVSQDATKIRAMEGERRLLEWK